MSKAFHAMRRVVTLAGFGALGFMVIGAAADSPPPLSRDGVPSDYKIRGTNYGVAASPTMLPEFLPPDAKPPHPSMAMAPRIRSEAGTGTWPGATDYDALFPPEPAATKPPAAPTPAAPVEAVEAVEPTAPTEPEPVRGLDPELNPAEVARVIRYNSEEIRDCYLGLLDRAPGSQVTATAVFTISPVGTVQDLTIRRGNAGDAIFESCLSGVINRLIFPAGHEPTSVSYPFRFVR